MHSDMHTEVHIRVHRCRTGTNEHKCLSALAKILTGCGAGCRSLRSRLKSQPPTTAGASGRYPARYRTLDTPYQGRPFGISYR